MLVWFFVLNVQIIVSGLIIVQVVAPPNPNAWIRNTTTLRITHVLPALMAPTVILFLEVAFLVQPIVPYVSLIQQRINLFVLNAPLEVS